MTVRLVVHEFGLGDVEDPDIYAAEPIWQWERSDAGRWVMANAIEPPIWKRYSDRDTFAYKYKIVAEFSDQNAVFYQLKYGHQHR